ncbi:probable mediator of RNA polymerase II transcription subunit 26c isoform X2 [Amborella trichopoda]|uniref:probable mediator of RNA polymerase II transcription subunit 26c isoform X2 n=1 Tax=Amborella trichopoda TaxID=13333 RepID=UPI0009BE751F|nr:probable mediator of RNA polymerase II transcription subunit 26c isoform X2 [Amborella trichopoda]|eukprot:XP_020527370.1 probable mediator of RNA polymerase II transcription subunit 26c isoform X2 [Amborella trichopoda]
MDLDEFRSLLKNSGLDVWTAIESAISLAQMDYRDEFKVRRDGIAEKLYTSNSVVGCHNCDLDLARLSTTKEKCREERESSHDKGASPSTPQSLVHSHRDEEQNGREEEHREPVMKREEEGNRRDEEHGSHGGLIQDKLLAIKEDLEDPDQSEDSVIDLLQSLTDMDVTVKALKETDIGRHVNGLRKHPSTEVRRLVKHLIRKWKELVDEWVSTAGEGAAAAIVEGESPQQNHQARASQNGNQVRESKHSPNGYSSGSGMGPNYSEIGSKGKGITPQREAQTKPNPIAPISIPAQKQKENAIDLQRLASARKRLHENYQEAENAKRQRTIQVMDIHDIPKPKNTFISRNKGGFHKQHW